MAFQLNQIKFVETGPYQYQLQFTYNTHALQTNNLPKNTTQAALVTLLQNICIDDDAQSSTANYNNLKALYDGKNVTI